MLRQNLQQPDIAGNSQKQPEIAIGGNCRSLIRLIRLIRLIKLDLQQRGRLQCYMDGMGWMGLVIIGARPILKFNFTLEICVTDKTNEIGILINPQWGTLYNFKSFNFDQVPSNTISEFVLVFRWIDLESVILVSVNSQCML